VYLFVKGWSDSSRLPNGHMIRQGCIYLGCGYRKFLFDQRRRFEPRKVANLQDDLRLEKEELRNLWQKRRTIPTWEKKAPCFS
jgi:hypothetical protein